MSLAYAVRPAVIATAIESAVIIAAIICWVMFVSYTLDRRYDWHKKLSRRLIFQICLGGGVPYGLLLVYLWQIYGLDMMLGVNTYSLWLHNAAFLSGGLCVIGYRGANNSRLISNEKVSVVYGVLIHSLYTVNTSRILRQYLGYTPRIGYAPSPERGPVYWT